MALSIFKAFRSTVTPPNERMITSQDKLLVDPQTGAPIGFLSPTANGADARFTPVDLTAAQIASPTAAMIADLDATFRLNVAPYTRYQSNGSAMVQLAPGNDVQLSTGLYATEIVYSPFTVDSVNYPEGISIQGTVSVRSLPA